MGSTSAVMKLSAKKGRGKASTGVLSAIALVVLAICAGLLWVVSRISVWVWTVARPLIYDYRRMLWPWLILGLLWALRDRIVNLPVPTLAAYGALGCVLIVFYLRRKLDRQAEWVYAVSALVATWSYLLFYSEYNVREVNVAAILMWAGYSAVWWVHHPTRFTSRLGSGLVELWNANVRDLKGSPLAGVETSAPVPFQYGTTLTLQLVRGVHDLKTAEGALAKVSTALDVPLQNLIVEHHPNFPKTPSKLRLQVVERSPIENTVLFDRPRHEDGRILLGPYADGQGEASLRLYTDNSMWSTFIVGGMGSGKSRLEEIIAITALALRDVGQHTVLFYMDGQDGASSAALYRYADWAVGVDGVLRMLSALERVARHRQLENRVNGWAGFTPGPDRPGILVMMDEVHRIFELAPARFADAMSEWRKIGIAFCAADQASDLKRTFANEGTIRTGLLTGNGIGMRCTSRSAGSLIPGLETDLFDLPVLSGYGVLVAAPGSGLRTAPFRGRYAPDKVEQEKAAAKRKPFKVPTIEEWFERYPSWGLDLGAGNAAGSDYIDRQAHAEAEYERTLRAYHGQPDPGPTSSGNGSSGGGSTPYRPSPDSNVRVGAFGGAGSSGTTAAQILALEWSGALSERTLQQIFADLPEGTVENTVQKSLSKLIDLGKLERVGHGVYSKTS